MNDDKKEMQDWLKHFSDKVQKNVTIVTKEELNQDYMLHISKATNIRDFTPFISHRASTQENRNILRVHVAPSICGCMIGYASIEEDFLNYPSGVDGYKGGWKIYSIPFDVALKPNGRLVYDSKHSDEYWLITYNKKTVKYPAVSAGEMFLESLTMTARSGNLPVGMARYMIKVTKEDGMWFSKKKFLTKGYWSVYGSTPGNYSVMYSDKDFEVSPITKEQYEDSKRLSADLLSYTEVAEVSTTEPNYAKW